MATTINHRSICEWFMDKYEGMHPHCDIRKDATSFDTHFIGQIKVKDKYHFVKKTVEEMEDIVMRDLNVYIKF